VAAIIIAMIRVSIGFSIASYNHVDFFRKNFKAIDKKTALVSTPSTRVCSLSEMISMSPRSPQERTERGAKLTDLNDKLHTVEKAQFAKSCPAVANTSPSSAVR
jgi:hypothetical protein